jgi:Uri superfamily endonuclease
LQDIEKAYSKRAESLGGIKQYGNSNEINNSSLFDKGTKNSNDINNSFVNTSSQANTS